MIYDKLKTMYKEAMLKIKIRAYIYVLKKSSLIDIIRDYAIVKVHMFEQFKLPPTENDTISLYYIISKYDFDKKVSKDECIDCAIEILKTLKNENELN